MSRPRSKLKRVVFSLIPALLLLLVAEGGVRLASLARPALLTMPLPEESAGLFREDDDLFWSLRGDIYTRFERATVTTNSLGLRGEEIEPRREGEIRILSLGESSTFGVGVSDAETYSAQLQERLRAELPSATVTVINAGVSAYSSFQSVKYLELRGLELEPDLVLFYHELNDYLPSSVRDSSRTEVGVLKTDRQLYESRVQGLHRSLMRLSALYRLASNRLAYRKVQAFDAEGFDNPLMNIGLPDIAIPPRLRTNEADKARTGLNEKALGRRVSEQERLDNFEWLKSTCEERGIALVLIHPAYLHSSRHECLLTRFCRENGVPMLEAFDSLHPPGVDPRELYVDVWHPGPEGHRRLAQDLALVVLGELQR